MQTSPNQPHIRSLGNRTWIVGLHEAVNALPTYQTELIENTVEELGKGTAWFRYGGGRKSFGRECREGDLLIVIWQSRKGAQTTVHRASSVLRKRRSKRHTIFFYREPHGRNATISWTRFCALLKQLDYPRKLKRGSIQLVSKEMPQCAMAQPGSVSNAFSKHLIASAWLKP